MGLRRCSTAVAAAVAISATAAVAAAQAVSLGDATRANPVDVSSFKPSRSGRLVGGRVVGPNETNTAAVFFTKIFVPNGLGFFCGGSLLDARHVLTRAGCLVQAGDVLRIGGVGIFDGLEYTVGAVANHPQWDATGDLYDVAVLTIANPPTTEEIASAGLVPVRLNGWEWSEEDTVKPESFTVAGFGAVDAGATSGGSPQLKVGQQPLTPWATCKTITDQIPIDLAIDAQVCTNMDESSTTGLCSNDMGGPLFIKYEFEGSAVYQLFGVASYWVAAIEGAVCPTAGLPNVYTRVEKVRTWVWGVLQAGW